MIAKYDENEEITRNCCTAGLLAHILFGHHYFFRESTKKPTSKQTTIINSCEWDCIDNRALYFGTCRKPRIPSTSTDTIQFPASYQ